jgi:hypothetical protein
MNKDNVTNLPARHDHVTELSRIVESTIDTQLVLSKRMAKTENEVKVTGKCLALISCVLAILVLIQQYQITQL